LTVEFYQAGRRIAGPLHSERVIEPDALVNLDGALYRVRAVSPSRTEFRSSGGNLFADESVAVEVVRVEAVEFNSRGRRKEMICG